MVDGVAVALVLHQREIVVGGLVAGVELDGLAQLRFSFVHFAILKKELAVLHVGRGLDGIGVDARPLAQCALIGHPPGIGQSQFVILPFQVLNKIVLGIFAQDAAQLIVSGIVISVALGLLGQRETGLHKTGERRLVFDFDATADFFHQVERVGVELG